MRTYFEVKLKGTVTSISKCQYYNKVIYSNYTILQKQIIFLLQSSDIGFKWNSREIKHQKVGSVLGSVLDIDLDISQHCCSADDTAAAINC